MSKGFVNFKNKIGKVVVTGLLVGATTVGAHAAGMEAITTSNLNMRTGESTRHKIITTIKKGEKVEVLDREGSWWKVKYNNKTGYSYKNYLTIVNNNEVKQEGKVSVGSSRLNVRTGAGTNYRIIGKLHTGDLVQITGTQGSWYEINFKGSQGFVSKKYVKDVHNSGNNEGSTAINKVMKVNTGSSNLNVRTGAGTGYSIKGKLASGTLVNVIEKTSNGWYKIEYKNGTGFVSANYLVNVSNGNNSSSEKVEVIGTAKVKTGGARLNLRKGAGTNTTILAKLNDGLTVQIVKDDKPVKGWTKVKVGNLVGYVSSEYLGKVTETPSKPEQKPEQKPEEKPEQKPEEKPEQKPEEKPSEPGLVINHAPILEHDEVYKTDLFLGFEESDILKLIKATDKEDGDISDRVKLEYKLPESTGEFTVKITVTDSQGATATSYMKVIIEDATCQPNHAPVITAKEDLVLQVGDKFDVSMLNIKATDTEDKDLTEKVKVTGTVDTKNPGRYELTLTVEDKDGAETVKKVYVTVEKKEEQKPSVPGEVINHAPVLEAVEELVIEEGSVFSNDLLKIVATDKEDGTLTDRVEISGDKVDTSNPGEYNVILIVTDKQGAKATKTVKVIVEMKEDISIPGETINGAPVINSVDSLTLTVGDTYNRDMLKVNVTDKENDKVTVDINDSKVSTKSEGHYEVVITATDAKGAKTVKKVFVTVNAKPSIPGEVLNHAPVLNVSNFVLDINTEFSNDMLGATATDKDNDKVTITYSGTVNTKKVGTYPVIVTATDAKGAKATKTVQVKVNAVKPTISAKSITITQGDNFSYSMLGASATDCEGTAISVNFSGDVKNNEEGTYNVTITAQDKWGLTASKVVTVTVEKKAPQGITDPNSSEFQTMVANEMYALVNGHRRANGVSDFVILDRLAGMAQYKSQHMAQNNYFDHTYNGQFVWEMTDQFGEASGENIAMNTMNTLMQDGVLDAQDAKTLANRLFNQWKNSPGHNNAMLDDWSKSMGFGFYVAKNGGNYTVYATQNFYGLAKAIEEPQELGKEEVKEEEVPVDNTQEVKPEEQPQVQEEAPQVQEQPQVEEQAKPEEAPQVEMEDTQQPTVEME